ncbi:unnamed protein product [Rotaria sordida]|nr:unnamed protein product [Rotaria sordida]
MMGDTYADVKKSAKKLWHLERARIALYLESGIVKSERHLTNNKYWIDVQGERYLQVEQKNVISQDLYDKYVNDYIPLSHIRETILDILYTRNSPRYETCSYYAPLDKYQDCIDKSYASYGHDNNYTESRYFKEGDFIDIILENIHYYPLDINNMNDYREYDYKFGQIPVPMAWSGGLFEDRDSILSSLKVGNVVRCQFKKLMINNNKECCGGGAWYFAIIQIIDDTVYGLLKDFYYDPKEYNLNEGDILIFNKDNITEIPHL